MHRRLKIRGLGRYLPRRVVHNEELAPALGMSPADIVARSGVVTRYRADASETAAEMGARAAREALGMADLRATDLDLILNASATPQQALPDTAPFLQAALGLGASGIPCLSVGSACLSFLSALDVAASLIATQRYARILIVSSEISSVGLDFADPETAPLFGDGAAAVVVSEAAPDDPACLHDVLFETYGDGASLTEIPGCGTRRPPTCPETTREDSLFRMNGPALLKLAAKRGRPFLARLSARNPELSRDDTLLVPHQASRAGMRLLEVLGFSPEQTVVTLPSFGNCVAASIPLALFEAVASGRLTPGKRALLLGTGAGVSFGAALLTL